jgi:hypothetical protein
MNYNALRPIIKKQSILEELEKLPAEPIKPTPETKPETTPINIKDPENYIILEGREHKDSESYEYQDLLVAMQRLSYSPEIEQVEKTLERELPNTALTSQNHEYDFIGKINWMEALKLNLMLGGRTLNPRQGIDFLIDLQDGIEGRKKLYNGRGEEINKKILERIHKDAVELRDPYRAEWFDADFKFENGQMFIHYDHILQNGILVPQRKEVLEYLDEHAKIKLRDTNRHGLPIKKDANGEINYGKLLPDNISVARLLAWSDGVSLSCSRCPTNRNRSLGVRFSRAKN